MFFHQDIFTQSQNELTQLCETGDDSTLGGNISPTNNLPPISPLNLPWGRLIPCSRHVEAAAVTLNHDSDNNKDTDNTPGRGKVIANPGGGIDLFPRNPLSDSRLKQQQQQLDDLPPPPAKTIQFLGLEDLQASDRFNEYVMGRSLKCDIINQKLQPHPSQDNDQLNVPTKSLDWVHSMISNRHCHIFCMLKNGSFQSKAGMDVYIEDSSGNGTVINNTTLLRRGEKRLLHTGDEICLINPATLRKRIPSIEYQRHILQHYSYIFVNVHQQQQQGRSGGLSIDTSLRTRVTNHQNNQSPTNYQLAAKRKGFVDVRAVNSPTQKKQLQNLHGGVMGPPISPPKPRNHLKNVISEKPPHYSPKNKVSNDPSISSRRRIEEFYDLRDLLGSGTCGEVRRAIHRQSGEQRAVKIISMRNNPTSRNHTNARRKEIEATLKAEASILQSLNHPYIVKLIDLFVSDTAIYLVMEMLHGGDLFDRIVEKGQYSEMESRRIMRRILSAVYYLHEERDVVHRDLKPENILCVNRSSDIEVKLTDFGLAKNMTEDGLKTFCGTPLYFAPEVLLRRHTIAGQGRYGKEADMWSLGVILYILLSGAPPFDASDNINALASAKIDFRGKRWTKISSGAKELVRLFLTTDPIHRINIQDACKHPWILMEDGDTHTHPLEDPSLKKNPSSTAPNEQALLGKVLYRISSKEKKEEMKTEKKTKKKLENIETHTLDDKRDESSLVSRKALPQSSPSPSSKREAKNLFQPLELRETPQKENGMTHKVSLLPGAIKLNFEMECETEKSTHVTSPNRRHKDVEDKKNIHMQTPLSTPDPPKQRKRKETSKTSKISEMKAEDLELADDKIVSDFSDEEEEPGKEKNVHDSPTSKKEKASHPIISVTSAVKKRKSESPESEKARHQRNKIKHDVENHKSKEILHVKAEHSNKNGDDILKGKQTTLSNWFKKK